jgi:hypothetical protein
VARHASRTVQIADGRIIVPLADLRP